MLEGKAALTVVEKDESASDGIGDENVVTKVGTTKLFGLPEATGVAVADGEAAKPAPDAANASRNGHAHRRTGNREACRLLG